MRETVALLVNNLAYLGVSEYAEAHHGIIISSRTFITLDNHKRASEVIFYSLLKLLDPAECRQRLSGLFPCTDGRKAKEFRNALFKWLTELKRSSTILSTSIIRRSLLDDCAGERYEDLLFSLSSYVYLRQIRADRFPQCNFKSSLAVVQRVDVTIQELFVHDLIQAYRLRKLNQERIHYRKVYKDFAHALSQEESIAQGSQTEIAISPQDTLDQVQLELTRIQSVAPHSRCIRYFEPVPFQYSTFYTSLPWEQSSEAKEKSPTQRRRVITVETKAVARHLADLRSKTNSLPSPRPRETVKQIENVIDYESAGNDMAKTPRPSFRRRRYENYMQELHSRLERLEPGHVVAPVVNDEMMESLRQLTPAKPAASLLPRRVKQREVRPLQDSLQRTLLKSRVKPMLLPELGDEDEDVMPPSTPHRPTTTDHVSSTVKTINRLIDVLNDSDTSMSMTRKDRRLLTTGKSTNRRLESSFSLWANHDDHN